MVTDEAGRYAGLVLTPEIHGADESVVRVSEVLHYPKDVLLPQMTIKEAVQMFESTESDALAVVDAADTRKVIGLADRTTRAAPLYRGIGTRQRRELSGE